MSLWEPITYWFITKLANWPFTFARIQENRQRPALGNLKFMHYLVAFKLPIHTQPKPQESRVQIKVKIT